ncbi:chemotaxis protein methyltransferase CheR [Chitinivorax tropicus]|uniref:Chemotaxis protein methyltransferase CheR n=1 Tax=Chitinivorax tropicus TaxID=714531 RepID=A0A840MMP2_9PROT|nr:chemotaxis protein CheB [Chitinivorax tropicus]MBB5018217.1 chemotaxis protein methyltransferase CheR [Chitinivorax tropicus]
MTITLHQLPPTCHLAVLGRQDHPAAVAELGQALQVAFDDQAIKTVEVSFYDADTLRREAIELLASHLGKTPALKIIAYHATLAHGLIRLGLPVKQVLQQPSTQPAASYRAIAMAGSAGSLDKILHLVSNLPLGKVSLFVLQHLDEHQPNLLDQLLKVRTDYQVIMPQHLTTIEPGTLYIAPPGYHMKVAHGMVYLTQDRKIQYSRPSIDALFASLASEYQRDCIAVLLCGYGQDGTAGCAALRQAQARVLIEDSDECGTARSMPDSARATGQYDSVAKLSTITSLLAAAVHSHDDQEVPHGPLLELFLEALSQQCGYDFRHYQRDSLRRLLKAQMQALGIQRFSIFQYLALTEPMLLQQLIAGLTVNVTCFFRHPEQLAQVRQHVFPYLASFPEIKIWSAGCATGEEAYSLAIMLHEAGLLERSHLFATDMNAYQLEAAKAGLFPSHELPQNQANYLTSGGVRHFEDYIQPSAHYIKAIDWLGKQILFYRHTLTAEGIFNEFQLIVCRNVLIYFDLALQREVLRKFACSLHVDGFLVLGPQDGINLTVLEMGFVPYKPGSHIYRYPRE